MSQINARHQVRDNSVTNEKLAGDITLDKLIQGALLLLADGSRGLTANWNVGGFEILGLTAGTTANSAVTKAQLDNAVAGFHYVEPVSLLSTVNVDIATGGLIDVDGVEVTEGQRVALIGQTDATQNGVYVASSAAWVRADDLDESAELSRGVAFFVTSGATYTNSGWWSSVQEITVGTTPITFIEFNKPVFKFSNGLSQTGQDVTLNVDPDGGLYLTANGLAVKLDSAVLEVTAEGLTIKANGVTNDHLAGGIALAKLSQGGELLLRDGSVAWTGNHNAGGNKLTNLAVGTAGSDAATVSQLHVPTWVPLVGVKDGVNTEFTYDNEVTLPAGHTGLVFWNGQLRSDVTLGTSSLTVTGFVPEAADSLTALLFL